MGGFVDFAILSLTNNLGQSIVIDYFYHKGGRREMIIGIQMG